MRGKLLLALGALALTTIAGGIAGADGCTEDDARTAAGSCKAGPGHANADDDYQIHCGSEGALPVEVLGVTLHANQTEDGGELEACSDEGSGNQHGRLVVQLSQENEGARAVLDSDQDQPFPAGWIIVQADQGNPGVWCSADEGPESEGDGYARGWDDPGPDGGLGPEATECVPEPPQR